MKITVIIIGIAILLSGCQTVTLPDNYTMTDRFIEASLGYGIDKKRAKKTLARWPENETITLSIHSPSSYELPAEYAQLIHERMAYAYNLAGLKILWLANNDTSARIEIHILPGDSPIINSGQHASCYVNYSQVSQDFFRKLRMYLSTKSLTKGKESCVDHEIMHALGFPGHSHRAQSVTSYGGQFNQFTIVDEEFIKLLYNRQILPNQSGVAAKNLTVGDIAARVFEKLNKDNPVSSTRKQTRIRATTLELTEDKSPVKLDHSFIKGGGIYTKFLVNRTQSYSRISDATYSKGYPWANVRYIKLASNRIFRKAPTFSTMTDIGIFKGKEGKLLGSTKVFSFQKGDKQVKARVQVFQTTDIHCVFMLYTKLDDRYTGGHAAIEGYLCDKKPISLEKGAEVFSTLQVSDKDPFVVEETNETAASGFAWDITADWQGVDNAANGYSFLDLLSSPGRFLLIIKDDICEGQWSKGTSNKRDWKLSCENGLSASGKLTFNGVAAFNGEGVDSQQRKIKILGKKRR